MWDEGTAEDIRNVPELRRDGIILQNPQLYFNGEETGHECVLGTAGYIFRQAVAAADMLKQLNSYVFS